MPDLSKVGCPNSVCLALCLASSLAVFAPSVALAQEYSTAQEDNFFDKHSGVEPEPGRWKHVVIEAPDPELTVYGWKQAAGGLGAVWAKENTREAIFDAMMRKETYATTRSRMLVRFFGGYDFTDQDAMSRLPADAGYKKGVPMGGPDGSPC